MRSLPATCRRKRIKRYVIFAGFILAVAYYNLLAFVSRITYPAVRPDSSQNRRDLRVWPEDDPNSDRILDQLSYIPSVQANRTIVIFLAQSASAWGVKTGDWVFIEESCPISNCLLTDSRRDGDSADVIIFRHDIAKRPKKRPLGQIWILYCLENPFFTPTYKNVAGQINYTATYRWDSDIVTPYDKYLEYDSSASPEHKSVLLKTNHAAGKTKKVAWLVSNCDDIPNGRVEYARNLSKYIEVDIYGDCGDLECSRHKSEKCFQMLDSDYKFYLAFENANCRDYITEKFFVNGLRRNIIPVVMGASRREYEKAGPKNSFIHVDDFATAKDLADYLHTLDKDDTKYNEYFRWKEENRGRFIHTKFWCRLCSLLNDPKPKVYEDINSWWRGPGICMNGGDSMVDIDDGSDQTAT